MLCSHEQDRAGENQPPANGGGVDSACGKATRRRHAVFAAHGRRAAFVPRVSRGVSRGAKAADTPVAMPRRRRVV